MILVHHLTAPLLDANEFDFFFRKYLATRLYPHNRILTLVVLIFITVSSASFFPIQLLNHLFHLDELAKLMYLVYVRVSIFANNLEREFMMKNYYVLL